MKKTNLIILLLLFILLPSCSKDYCNRCNSADQIKLFFHYKDKNGKDLLSDNINSAMLYIYDEYGTLITTQQIDKKTLEENKGLGVEVPEEGLYQIACWANLTDKTVMRNSDILGDALAENVGVSSSDPLYFGSSSFNFKGGIKQNIDINFKSKHVKFQVYVKGINKIGNLGLTLDNVPMSYNFSGTPIQSVYFTLKPLFEYDEINKGFVSNFNFLKPKILNRDITLSLQHPDIAGKTYTYNIIEYVKEHYPSVDITDLSDEVKIRMLIEFQGMDVTVSVPNWEDVETGGGIS